MMREHMGLYRGKRVDSGAWVEGAYVRTKRHHCIITGYIDDRFIVYGNYAKHVELYIVDPDTIGECTGLTDKNGKLIFEGDMLKPFDDDIDKMVVEFYNGVFMLSLYGERGYMAEYGWEEEGNYGIYECEPLESYGVDVKIIGNIHDNPELVEEMKGENNGQQSI